MNRSAAAWQPTRPGRPAATPTTPTPAPGPAPGTAWTPNDGLTVPLLLHGDPKILRTIYTTSWSTINALLDRRLSEDPTWKTLTQSSTTATHHDEAHRYLRGLVTEIIATSPLPTPGHLLKTASDLIAANHNNQLGPIQPLIDDPTITEVMVNGPHDIYVEVAGKTQRATGCSFADHDHLASIADRILAPLNRKNDVRDPLTDARLPNGSRVNITHRCLSPVGTSITIRKFPERVLTLASLVDLGAITQEHAHELANLVAKRASILVVGGTGSGKTTLLNALSGVIPTHERVVTIEDSLELQLNPHGHVVPFEARPADAAGSNAITIRQLVKNALRQRPDRIIVGEVRDGAALDMLQAMNTGHEGSMSTVHANGATEAIDRLNVLVATGGDIPDDKITTVIASALDLIVTVDRMEDGSRRITGLYEVPSISDYLESGEESLRPTPVWRYVIDRFDNNGTIHGHVETIGEISQTLRTRLTLDRDQPYPTWEDVAAACSLQATAAARRGQVNR